MLATGEDVPELDEVVYSYAEFGRDAEDTDNRFLWCQQIFRLLEDRERSLGVSYPFVVDSNALTLERRELEGSAALYVFLLCCSLLRYVPRTTMQRLTAHFESVSLQVLRRILPPNAEVDAYGTARGLTGSRFHGTQFERLNALATELRGSVLVEPQDFHPRDTGDNGLDLVGWLPLGDRAKGLPSFFAQCACGAKWDGKQYEAGHERWREFIHLKSPHAKITFIPHHFRKPGEYWYADGDVSGVLVDRLRAMRTLSGAEDLTAELPLVHAAWQFRLSTV